MAAVSGVADGVVVGSALVRLVEQYADLPDLASRIESRVRELVAPLRQRRFRFGRRH